MILANVRKLDDDQLRALEGLRAKTAAACSFFPAIASIRRGITARCSRRQRLLPLALGPLAGDLKEGAPSVGVVAQRFENPALELFNDPRNGTSRDAAIKLWFKLQERAASASRDAADGPRAARQRRSISRRETVRRRPRDRSAPPPLRCGLEQSADAALLPAAAPAARRFISPRPSIRRAISKSASRSSRFCPRTMPGKKATLTHAGRARVRFDRSRRRATRGVVEFSTDPAPGSLHAQAAGRSAMHYVVNASRRESDLQKLSDQGDGRSGHDSTASRWSVPAPNTRQLESARRFGREFWKGLLWALLAFMFLELILQQRFAGKGGRS